MKSKPLSQRGIIVRRLWKLLRKCNESRGDLLQRIIDMQKYTDWLEKRDRESTQTIMLLKAEIQQLRSAVYEKSEHE